MLGIPSSGVHSNGYTLARRVLIDDGPGLDARPPKLNGQSVADALLEPTVIYVRAVLDLLRSDVPVHGLAHITGGGVHNLLRLGAGRIVGLPVSVHSPALYHGAPEMGTRGRPALDRPDSECSARPERRSFPNFGADASRTCMPRSWPMGAGGSCCWPT